MPDENVEESIMKKLINKEIKFFASNGFFHRGKLLEITNNGIWFIDIKKGLTFFNFKDITELREVKEDE